MAERVQYELQQIWKNSDDHATNPNAAQSNRESIDALTWQDDLHQQTAEVQAAVTLEDEWVWLAVDRAQQRLATCDAAEAAFGLRVFRRRLALDLALLAGNASISVNGIPALALTVLRPRDEVLVEPDLHFFVTRRSQPHIGRPSEDLQQTKCPCCQIPLGPDTYVVSCPCGVAYHNETQENSPDVPEEDRLQCFQPGKSCLACGKRLSLEESLLWDPAEIN